MAKIANKATFFALWEAGVLGNRTRLWRNPWDAYLWGRQQSVSLAYLTPPDKYDEWKPEIGLRELGRTGGGKWCKVSWQRVLDEAKTWTSEGRKFILDDGAPDDKRTLCGEVCRTYRGWEGTLGVVQMPMREAMKRGLLLPRSGATVLALLDHYMDPSSRDDLDALLDLYPDATVEFSCFTIDVGIFPGHNTIFWETRDY